MAIGDIRSTVEAAKAATSTQTSGASQPASPGTGDQSQGTSTHFKTLEEADRAAREFQGRYDKLAAEWSPFQKWSALGPPEKLAQLFEQVIQIAGRSDFRDYAEGRLVRPGDGPSGEEDEILDPGEREMRGLKAELEALKAERANGASKVDGELAGLRFERAEANLSSEYGGLWLEHREKIRQEILRMVRNGSMSLDAVNESVLQRAFVASFDSPKAFEEAFRKHFLEKEERHRQTLNEKATTGPAREAPGGAPVALAKGFWEAVELGKQDLERQRREGRSLQ